MAAWLRDSAWHQGSAILFVVVGSIFIYLGAAGRDGLSGVALLGVALFAIGVAVPLVSQALSARGDDTARREDVE